VVAVEVVAPKGRRREPHRGIGPIVGQLDQRGAPDGGDGGVEVGVDHLFAADERHEERGQGGDDDGAEGDHGEGRGTGAASLVGEERGGGRRGHGRAFGEAVDARDVTAQRSRRPAPGHDLVAHSTQ
jgi:hypothetical protein